MWYNSYRSSLEPKDSERYCSNFLNLLCENLWRDTSLNKYGNLNFRFDADVPKVNGNLLFT